MFFAMLRNPYWKLFLIPKKWLPISRNSRCVFRHLGGRESNDGLLQVGFSPMEGESQVIRKINTQTRTLVLESELFLSEIGFSAY